MEKIITIVSPENVTIEDLFKGGFSAHEVKDLENTYLVVKELKVLSEPQALSKKQEFRAENMHNLMFGTTDKL